MMIKVAINGFGRIGRLLLRQMLLTTDFDVVAINDLSDAENLAYLFKYDSTHGRFHEDLIDYDADCLVINKTKRIKVLHESEPSKLPWQALGVDLVLECTGVFTSYEDCYKHILAGCKKVLLSAPGKGEMKTIVFNVNDGILDGSEVVVSSASCTTNCLAPVLNVLESEFGIIRGYMSTIHAYTNDQVVLDVTHKKGYMSRRGRASGLNIIPTSSGAGNLIGKVLPSLDGKFSGDAYRVPVMDGSMLEVTVELAGELSVESINSAFSKYVSDTLKFTMDPIVSSDVIGTTYGAIVDGLLTRVLVSGNSSLVRVVAWYDNEYGYVSQMLRTAKKLF